MEGISFNGLDRWFARRGAEVGRIAGRVLTEGGARPLRSASVVDFEERFAAAVGRPGARAVSVRSGTDALHFALRGLGVGAGDEVVVTAYSFVASASAVALAGARPVFVDVDPGTGLMDLRALRRALTPATRAIVAVQLYGHLLPFGDLEALAADAGVWLVEDAAQAFGSRRGGRAAGSLGVASTFSFDPTKALGGIETGGAVVTADAGLAEEVMALRYHGWDRQRRRFAGLGYNSQLSSANAAVLRWRLGREAERRARRRRLAARLAARLADLPAVEVTPPPADEEWNAYRFAVRLASTVDRDRLVAHLRAAGVETKIHYRYLLPDLALGRAPGPAGSAPIDEQAFPAARGRTRTTLSLPLHPELADHEVDRVVERLAAGLAVADGGR